MSKLEHVPIDAIDPNPFRRTGDYPYVERKLTALEQSIKVVGLWEGIIARKRGNRYENAFGHHRLEAARRSKLKTIPLIIRDLNDEQMLAFMGRENMEDYNADFLCMLETWEAAHDFLGAAPRQNPEAIEIARLLGWVDKLDKSNMTARACHNALSLIRAKHMTRSDLKDLNVNSVRELVERVNTRINQIETMAKGSHLPKDKITSAKKKVAQAGKLAAEQTRKGNIRQKDIALTVDSITHNLSKKSNLPLPVFEAFLKNASDAIARMLNDDSADQRIREVTKVLGDITNAHDRLAIARVSFELGQLKSRITEREKWLIPISQKVKYLPIQGR